MSMANDFPENKEVPSATAVTQAEIKTRRTRNLASEFLKKMITSALPNPCSAMRRHPASMITQS